eukprot:288059_1
MSSLHQIATLIFMVCILCYSADYIETSCSPYGDHLVTLPPCNDCTCVNYSKSRSNRFYIECDDYTLLNQQCQSYLEDHDVLMHTKEQPLAQTLNTHDASQSQQKNVDYIVVFMGLASFILIVYLSLNMDVTKSLNCGSLD